ncbi:hypothetical protein ASE60_21035 [Ensifer sp. Root278]|nr:hypothetical protein ASE60_21035 [Ensifer sp. Root278]
MPVMAAERSFALAVEPESKRVKAAADRRGRSANAEIVATLEEAYPDPFARELRFMDEIDELAKKLERIRAGLLAEEIAKGSQEANDPDSRADDADGPLKKPEK